MLAGGQFPKRVPFCRMFGTSASLAASSTPMNPLRRPSATSLRTAESRTLVIEEKSASIEARYFMKSAGVSGRPTGESKEVIQGFSVIPPRIGGCHGIKHHPAKPLPGIYEAGFGRIEVLRGRPVAVTVGSQCRGDKQCTQSARRRDSRTSTRAAYRQKKASLRIAVASQDRCSICRRAATGGRVIHRESSPN